MSRPVLFLALVSFVAGVTAAEAKPSTAKPTKRDAKRDKRKPTKSTRANMPRGFVWPPSRKMDAMADACEKNLDELGVTYKPAGKSVGRVVRPMRLGEANEIGGITFTPVYSRDQIWDCQLVLTFASVAPRLYEIGVREVKFGSAFRWSKVRVGGRTKNVLSRHALGIALDVVSFVDAEGREAVVDKDYKRDDELLLSIERAVNDSGQFRVLLTPRNDPRSHSDHFHFEANPDYSEDEDQGRPAS